MLRLILRNLMAHPLRAFLTTGSVFVAVFLLCTLRATIGGLTASVEQASTNRLWVQSAVSLYVDLPLAYGPKIEQVEGVERICRWQWFGGEFRDAEGFFAQFAVDPETFLPAYPELEIVDGSYEAFENNRIGCLIGTDLVAEYGWKVGDRVPILSQIFTKPGGQAWDFTVEGIYRSKAPTIDQKTLYFHHDYLRETLETGGANGEPGVGVYMVQVKDDYPVEPVMAAIDGLYENGPQRVQTTTEGEFNRSFVSMLGNVPGLLTMIGGAVLFAIFFAVLNTMLMAGRERVRAVGIMKALGFSNGAVIFSMVGESVLLCSVGGLAAVGVVFAIQESVARFLVSASIPGFVMDTGVALLGIGIAVAIGLISGLVPGWQASRLAPVEALRMEA